MSKSKITKILVAVLSFCLLIGTVVGVSAFAEENVTDGEYDAPAIISKNVEYSSQTYLHYAVPVASIPEADRVEGGVWLRILNADGSLVYNQLPEEGTTVVNGIECYTFKGRGVPAKELNTVELTQVETKSGAKSEICSYSVEDYLYQKLYNEGYAKKTAEDIGADGKDYKRRTLYYDLLKYGAIAQKVLEPEAEDKIADSHFAIAENALAAYGRFEEPTRITLRYDYENEPKGKTFFAWNCAFYDNFGELISEEIVADGSVITAEGYVSLTPYYETYTHNYMDFEGLDKLPSGVGASVTDPLPKYSDSFAGVSDGKVVVNKAMTLGDLKTEMEKQGATGIPSSIAGAWWIAPNTKLADANAVIMETDFSLQMGNTSDMGYITIYSGQGSGTKIYWAHLRIVNGYLKFDTEYVRDSAGQKGVGIDVTTPIKCDGTVYKLTVKYYEGAWGEAGVKFYVDGELIHTTHNFYDASFNNTKTPPKATAIGSVHMNLPNNGVGIITLDNAAMTQVKQLVEPEKVGGDDSVVDFDASMAGISEGTDATDLKYYTYDFDKKTGNGYVRLTKNDADGLAIDVPVTYREADKPINCAILSFDYYMEDSVTRFDNQIFAGHAMYNSGELNNKTTPIMATMSTTVSGNTGKWIHYELVYEVVEMDGELVTKIYYDANSVGGGQAAIYADETYGIYKNGSSYFKVFGNPGNHSGGGIDIPGAEDLMVIRINLNSAARGDVRFDNLSFKLINKASE